MNIVVGTEALVEPRTVAASEMVGGPRAEPGAGGPRAGGGSGAPPETSAAPAAPRRRERRSGRRRHQRVLATSVIGCPIYVSEGSEMGEVENVILAQGSGSRTGVLVEVGGILGSTSARG